MSNNNYYIFLDIDGTLWDFNALPVAFVYSKILCEDSINAINNLAEQLENNGYNPQYIIISKQRTAWERCKQLLYNNGLRKDILIKPLPLGRRSRGARICIYMYNMEHNINCENLPQRKKLSDLIKIPFARSFNNYVVIDDNIANLIKTIPNEKIIQTNINSGRLKQNMVDKYLVSQNINIENQK